MGIFCYSVKQMYISGDKALLVYVLKFIRRSELMVLFLLACVRVCVCLSLSLSLTGFGSSGQVFIILTDFCGCLQFL